MATARKTKRSAPRRGRARSRPRPEPEIEVRPPIAEAEPSVMAPEPIEQPLDGLPLSVPEPALAQRVPEPEPARPLPSGRRAIFFDVENTSRAEHIARVIAHLAVDRAGRRTEFFAVGNWRVIGHDTARLLARHGAALVHSAPSVGVRDWSDLRIAVASGVWLAGARPNDVIEIVSDDRAFDAVGDVATSLGVTFRRLSYRGLLGMPAPAPAAVERVERHYDHDDRGGRRRRRRGGRGRSDHGAPRPVQQAPVHHAPRPAIAPDAEPHTAPHDEIVSVVRDLVRARGTVTLDSLANALKARGFSRPPGSPRLITRLRRIKELEVNRAGVITVVGGGAEPPVETAERAAIAERSETADRTEPTAPPLSVADEEAAEVTESRPSAEHTEDTGDVHDTEDDAPDPRNREGAHLQMAGGGAGDGGRRRRRSRRGGRRRRGRGGDGRDGGGGRPGGGGGGRPGGGGGGTPPRDRDVSGTRGTGADRARDVASRYAPRDVAPSWISGQPLA